MALGDKKNPGRDVKAHSGRISRDELTEKGGTITMGKGHWVRKELLRLELGEILFVHRSDWNWKGRGNGPIRIANDLNRSSTREFVTELVADGSGWAIERTK